MAGIERVMTLDGQKQRIVELEREVAALQLRVDEAQSTAELLAEELRRRGER